MKTLPLTKRVMGGLCLVNLLLQQENVSAQGVEMPFCIAPMPYEDTATMVTMVRFTAGVYTTPVMDSTPMLPFKDSGAEAEFHRIINLSNAQFLESIKLCNALSVVNRPACIKVASDKKSQELKRAYQDRERWESALSEQSDRSSRLYFGPSKRKTNVPINM